MSTVSERPARAGTGAGHHHQIYSDEVLRRLSTIDLLRALPAEEIQELVTHAEPVNFPGGARFITQGSEGDSLYFIETGTARVERDGQDIAHVGPGDVVGEIALLTGTPRNANVFADSDMWVWRISKAAFDGLFERSPQLRYALQLVAARRTGMPQPQGIPSPQYWVATALRAIEARYRGVTGWQMVMFAGLAGWIGLFLNEQLGWFSFEGREIIEAGIQLVAGLLVLQGACEAFIVGVERMGARHKWDGFISGTVGSLLSTLPEFVVIFFLVRVDPLAAFVTSVVTIFNNALAFSIYSFFLPKDGKGAFAMPRSLTQAGGEVIISGAAIALIVGLVMIVLRTENQINAFSGTDLIAVGAVLLATYAYYIYNLVQYNSEGLDDKESVPPDPHHLGHDTSTFGIFSMFALGIVGAYCGGEAIGGFAETALGRLGLPTIPTAAALAFFAGISEYIIVFKSHRRGELGVALSNVFGGITQVMFLLLPFALIVIGLMGFITGSAHYIIPINTPTTLLMLLLFPLFYALYQYMEQEKSLSNLDAAGMTGIYLLLLYFLFTSPS
jgi:Ca2+/Na+ antiporter